MRRKIQNIEKYLSSFGGIDKIIDDVLGELFVGSGKRINDTSSGTTSNGTNTSAYTSSQKDSNIGTSSSGNGLGNTVVGGLLGLIGSGINMWYNSHQADVAYERQNEFYDNHLSMSAKVQEYKDAGLNPMSLAGAGVGATSAPSVQQGQGVDMSSLVGTLLNYRVQSKMIDADVKYKQAQTAAQELENKYIEQRRKQEIANAQQTYRRLTADADIAEVTAIWAPEMLDSEFRNREADTALKSANKTLTEEKVKQVQQEIKQAEERFPEEIRNLRQNYAQMAALTYMYQTAGKNNVQELENLKQQFANLEEQNREIKNRADLHQTEIDTFMARNSKVTEGEDGMLIVTAPDGTITRFDPYGIKRTTNHTLDGKVVKK